MDGTRFDRWVRSFGRRTSRRGAARGLVAAGAALVVGRARAGEVAAQAGSVPLGGACVRDRQCSQVGVDPPYLAACSDNGFDYDGSFNCCVIVGARCWADEHCCGPQLCIDGFCTAYDDYINSLGDVTDDILHGPGGYGSLGLGEPCGAPEQCYSGSGLEATCADNGIDYGGICCTFYGFGCASDRHCCGSLSCLGGVCTVPYEGYG